MPKVVERSDAHHQWSFEPVEIEVEKPAVSLGMAAAAGGGTIGTFVGGPVFGIIGAAVGGLIVPLAHAIIRHHNTPKNQSNHSNGSGLS